MESVVGDKGGLNIDHSCYFTFRPLSIAPHCPRRIIELDVACYCENFVTAFSKSTTGAPFSYTVVNSLGQNLIL